MTEILPSAQPQFPPSVSRRRTNADAPVEPPAEPFANLASKLRNLKDEIAQGIPEPRWRLNGLLAGKLYLGGYIGAGKTPTNLRMIRALLAGEDFLGFRHCGIPDGYRVVYLTQEGEGTFLPAVREAGLTPYADKISVGYLHNYAMDEWPSVIDQLAGTLEPEAGLVVVDTMIDWTQVRDENDAAAMSEALRPLNVALQGRGLDSVVIGHTVKGANSTSDADADIALIRGSGAVIANADIVYLLKVAKPQLDGNARCLKRVRSRYAVKGAPERTYTVIQGGEMREISMIQQGLGEQASAELRLLGAVRENGGSIEERELLRSAFRDESGSMHAAIPTLVAEGAIERFGKGQKGSPKGVRLRQE